MPHNSTLVDTVRYADPDDVSVYIRNKVFTDESDPTEERVEKLLLQASERIDRYTGRAWRTRRVEDVELRVELSRNQRGNSFRTRFRSRGFVRRPPGYDTLTEKWAMVFLPHYQLQEWDIDRDELVVLRPTSEVDITDDYGRDSAYTVDERRGLVYIDHRQWGGKPNRSGLRRSSRVRVTYHYGLDVGDTEGSDAPDEIPVDIREACAKMVASDLMHTDQYGSLIASGPENVPDQSTGAAELWAGAMDILDARKTERHS